MHWCKNHKNNINNNLTFVSDKTDSCTDQWWSTERCWDHWREWSLYWLKTLEGNGENTLIPFYQAVGILCSPSPLCLHLIQATVAVPSADHGYSSGRQQWVIRQAGQSVMKVSFWCFCRHLCDFFSSAVIHWLVKVSTDTIWNEAPLCSVKVVQQFHEAGFMVDLNEDQGATLNKKIRSAQLAQYNYIFGKKTGKRQHH